MAAAAFLGCFILTSPANPVFGQSNGAVVEVASGYPTELPADGTSETVLTVDISSCTFGAATGSGAQYSMEATTSNGTISPAFSSTLDGGEFPPPLTLKAGTLPFDAVIQVKITYCPEDAVFVMGVCSDPATQDATCTGGASFRFVEVEPVEGTAGSTPTVESIQPGVEDHHHDGEDHHHPETEVESDSQGTSLADLYRDLEEYLAGEGITAPTPGQIAASGIALTTLLASWLLLNQMSGVGAEKSLQVIDAWRLGDAPPEPVTPEEPPAESPSAPQETPSSSEQTPGEEKKAPSTPPLQIPDSVPEADKLQPPPPPQPAEPEQPAPPKPKPSQESTEDRLMRGIQDAQDLDDALKKTTKDLTAFENSIPESVRNSDAWKKNVAPKLEKIKNMLKKGELDKGRTWLDRAEQLLQLRREIEHDLDHLPSDSREAILWTERTLKALGHFASDTYQSLVIDPAKSAGKAVLPSQLAERWNQSLDELNQELSSVFQQVGELPRKGARLLTHGNLQDQAQDMLRSSDTGAQETGRQIQELYGPREVPVEYPDFWGRGTKKVRDLWNHTMRCLFHDR